MDGGIQISTGQVIAALVYIVGQTVALILYVRHVMTDSFKAQLLLKDQQMTDVKTIHERDRQEWVRRVERFEARDEQTRQDIASQMALLRQSVDAQQRSVEVAEAIASSLLPRARETTTHE